MKHFNIYWNNLLVPFDLNKLAQVTHLCISLRYSFKKKPSDFRREAECILRNLRLLLQALKSHETVIDVDVFNPPNEAVKSAVFANQYGVYFDIQVNILTMDIIRVLKNKNEKASVPPLSGAATKSFLVYWEDFSGDEITVPFSKLMHATQVTIDLRGGPVNAVLRADQAPYVLTNLECFLCFLKKRPALREVQILKPGKENDSVHFGRVGLCLLGAVGLGWCCGLSSELIGLTGLGMFWVGKKVFKYNAFNAVLQEIEYPIQQHLKKMRVPSVASSVAPVLTKPDVLVVPCQGGGESVLERSVLFKKLE